MSTKCDNNGTAISKDNSENSKPWEHVYSTTMINGTNFHYTLGNASIKTISSLQGFNRTFRDELHEVIDSWRTIFVHFPWYELGERYNEGNVTVLPAIIEKRLHKVGKRIFFSKNILNNFKFSNSIRINGIKTNIINTIKMINPMMLTNFSNYCKRLMILWKAKSLNCLLSLIWHMQEW